MQKIFQYKYYFLALLLPLISMLLIYYFIGIAPFGELSLLTGDMRNQYVSYYSHLRSILHGDSGFLYSFSNGIGGEMVGLSAYYLLSPFNLIVYFFSVSTLPYFILLLTLLKVSFAGLTMFFYLNKSVSEKTAVIFSLIYALSGYNLVYQQNLMWLDGLIYLPLLLYGIDKLLNKEKSKIYVFALFLTILSNYYIAFMICLFVTLYLFANLVEKHSIRDLKVFFKEAYPSVKIFITQSLLAGLLTFFIIVPLIYSFSGGKSGFELEGATLFGKNFPISILFSKMVMGTFSKPELIRGLPNIYTSLITLPLVINYFISKSIKLKSKIVGLGFFIIVVLSFYFEGLNLFWHGLKPPVWFPYRYSFIFSVLLIIYAVKSFFIIEKRKSTYSLGATLITIFITVFYGAYVWYYRLEFIKFHLLIITCLFIISYTLYLFYNSRQKIGLNKSTIGIIILLELVFNGYHTLNSLDYAEMTRYTDYIHKNLPVINELKSNNNDFRIEKSYQFNHNDPLLLNYNGISHFSSTAKLDDISFLGKIGYRDNYAWANYSNGSSTLADSLLGIKYQLTNSEYSPYNSNREINGITVNENDNFLPLGFKVMDGDLDQKLSSTDPLENINTIYNNIGAKTDLLTKISDSEIEVNLQNLVMDIDNSGLYTFKKIDNKKPAFVNYIVDNKSKEPIHLFFDNTEFHDKAKLSFNDQYVNMLFDIQRHSANVISSDENKINIKLELIGDQLRINKGYFYRQNSVAYNTTAKNIKQNSFNFEEIKDGYIKGSMFTETKNSKVLFTIPYYKGWKAKVNGETTDIKEAFGALSYIELKGTGTFNIEMYYVPKGLYTGLIISTTSFIILVLYFRKDGNKKKRI